VLEELVGESNGELVQQAVDASTSVNRKRDRSLGKPRISRVRLASLSDRQQQIDHVVPPVELDSRAARVAVRAHRQALNVGPICA